MNAQRTRYKDIIAEATAASSDVTSTTFEMKHYRHLSIMLVHTSINNNSGAFIIEGSLDGTLWDIINTHYVIIDEPTDGYASVDGYYSPDADSSRELIMMDHVTVPFLRVRWEAKTVTVGTVQVQISAVS